MICQGCFRTCLWHVKGRFRIVYKLKRRISERQCESCYIALHNLCIMRSNPCLPRWQFRVERLNLIESDKSARKLAPKEYKGWRRDQVGRCVHWRLCQKFDFDCSHNRYDYESEECCYYRTVLFKLQLA